METAGPATPPPPREAGRSPHRTQAGRPGAIRRLARPGLLIPGLILGLGIGGGLGLWAARLSLVTWALAVLPPRVGLPPATAEVAAFDTRHLVLTNLRFAPLAGDPTGAPAATARRVTVRFRLDRLWQGGGGVNDISLEAPHLTGRLSAGGLSLPLLDPWLAPADTETPGERGPLVLPFDRLAVTNGTIRLATGVGPVVVTVTGHLSRPPSSDQARDPGLDPGLDPGPDPRPGLAFAAIGRAMGERLTLAFDGGGRVGPDGAVATAGGTLSGAVQLDTVSGLARGLSVAGRLTAHFDGATLAAESPGLAVSLQALEAPVRRALPPALAPLLSQPLHLALSPEAEDAPARVVLSAFPSGAARVTTPFALSAGSVMQAQGRIAVATPSTAQAPEAAALAGRVTLTARVADLPVPGLAEAVSGELGARITTTGTGDLALTVAPSARLTLARPVADLAAGLARLGLAPPFTLVLGAPEPAAGAIPNPDPDPDPDPDPILTPSPASGETDRAGTGTAGSAPARAGALPDGVTDGVTAEEDGDRPATTAPDPSAPAALRLAARADGGLTLSGSLDLTGQAPTAAAPGTGADALAPLPSAPGLFVRLDRLSLDPPGSAPPVPPLLPVPLSLPAGRLDLGVVVARGLSVADLGLRGLSGRLTISRARHDATGTRATLGLAAGAQRLSWSDANGAAAPTLWAHATLTAATEPDSAAPQDTDPDDATPTAGRLHLSNLRLRATATEVTPRLGQEISLRLSRPRLDLAGSLALDPARLTLVADLGRCDLAADGLHLSRPTSRLRAPLAVGLAAPLRLTARGGPAPRLALTEPLRLAPLTLALVPDDAPSPPAPAPTTTGPLVQIDALDLGLEGSWPPTAQAPPTLRLAASGLAVAGVMARDLAARLALTPQGPDGEMTAALTRLPGEDSDAIPQRPGRPGAPGTPGPPGVQGGRPLRLDLALAPDQTTAGRLALRGGIATPDGALTLTLRGWVDEQGESAALSLTGPPVRFSPQGLQPSDLFQGAAGLVDRASGTLGIKGSIYWTNRTITSDIQILLKDLSAEIAGLSLTGINAVLDLDRLWPPRSRLTEAAIARVDLGLPLTDVVIAFFLDGRGNLVIAQADLALAGGRVSTRSVLVPLAGGGTVIPLSVTDVSLAEVVALTKLEGLSASGRLSGRVPLRVEGDGRIWVDRATLTTNAPGVLRYQAPRPPEVIAGGNQGVLLVLTTLDNFQYDRLEVTLDGDSSGALAVGVHLVGRNPDVYGGYPVDMTLTLSGALAELVRDSLRPYTLPERIQTTIDRFMESLPRR